MATRAPRVFIYGSCVSRDTLEFLRPHGYSLTHYSARQSLISVYGRADLALLPAFTTSSPFQRRMIEEDWRSGLVWQLKARRAETDILLWDLCDERLGVRRLQPRGFVTRSVDLLSTGIDAALESSSDVVDFGEAKHLKMWSKRLKDFRALLDELDLSHRLVLLAPPWAERTVNGAPSLTSYGRSAAEANALFAPYHEAITSTLHCPIVTLPVDETESDPEHKWGPAPFHYSAANYTALAASIDEAVAIMSRRAL